MMSIKLYCGDSLKILRRLADCSVQCCVTSPPYWGLRDYGVAGQLGLEPTPEAYVARMVEVFAEVRRVLRADGTLWLNMGDSYAAGKCGRDDSGDNGRFGGPRIAPSQRSAPPSLKPKDLCGIPWRLAFALQAEGWFLRSDIIWHKPNPMPESVRDRPTKAHEYVFLLTKNGRYFWDQEAVRETRSTAPRATGYVSGEDYAVGPMSRNGHSQREGDQSRIWGSTAGRNIRSVWTITPKPFSGAHFATFPPALVERCVRAGTSEPGCCPQCGRPWERVMESVRTSTGTWHRDDQQFAVGGGCNGYLFTKTLGFRSVCSCPAADPVPCVVLDPFAGAGTVGLVCRQLGRDHVGIDLNPAYLKMARARIKAEQRKAVACGFSAAAPTAGMR